MRVQQSWMLVLAIAVLAESNITRAEPDIAKNDGQAEADKPIVLGKGPHLFVDEYLIARSEGVTRRVIAPARFLKEPVVTGNLEHQCWQPFFTVLHGAEAPASKRFRMWYNVDVVDDPRDGEFAGATGYLESADGVRWPGPYERLTSLPVDGRVRFGASVLDEGPRHPVPDERYKMLYFDAGKMIGPRVAFSRNGRRWMPHDGGKPILPKTPGDDIWTAGYDPIRKRYFLIGKHFGPHQWTNAEGEKLYFSIRRYFTSFSKDFKRWSDPEGFVYSPDAKDSGVTQWYGAAGFQTCGDLIVGFLRVLRDDLTPEGAPAEAIRANNTGFAGVGANLLGAKGGSGMGYTVLTWTRDGVNWHRDRHTDKFLEPDPAVGAWDHAMAWIGSSAPVGDELYLYYAGYRWGHKYRHSVDRQIGVVKMKRDRFVAHEAGEKMGTLTTPVVLIEGDALSLNVVANDGEVRVQVTTPSGDAIPGYRREDCIPISTDSLAAPVTWKEPLSKLRRRAVRLEFSLQKAKLFAFTVE